jgi:3-hydroxybutyryl-CoA dehydratase
MAENMRRGLWFEEFSEGMSTESRGRTITETDIVNFAGISGDFNPMHTDAEYVKNTDYKVRVAHGALVFSIATGLTYQQGFMEGTVMAFTNFEMKLREPVFIGDTIRVVTTVTKRRAMPSAGGGFVTFDIKVLNQASKIVQKGEWTVMIRSDPGVSGIPVKDSSTESA